MLFTSAQGGGWDEAQIVVQSLDGGPRKILIRGGTDGRYLSTGHLVYALRGTGTVLAVRFDPVSLSIIGGPVRVVEGVQVAVGAVVGGVTGAAHFAVSLDGTLAYVPVANVRTAPRTLVWVDRHGREESIAAAPQLYVYPRLAPDGTRLALDIQDENEGRRIWVLDFPRGTLTPLTSGESLQRLPLWTPDGQHIIFGSTRAGVADVFWQAANGTGAAEPLTRSKGALSDRGVFAHTMSPDGRRLVLRKMDGGGIPDLLMLDAGEGRRVQPPASSIGEPSALIQTSYAEENAEISPDGRWLAYQSNRSGAYEVYVQPFPDVASGQWPVSTAGGTEPLWARDGRELFYRAPKGALMRVSISPGSAWTAGTPARLFEAPSYALGRSGDFGELPYRTYACLLTAGDS